MKNRSRFLPSLILVLTVVAIAVYGVVTSIAYKPVITEAEFPFSITYEYQGQTVTINDVFKAEYVGNDGYADTLTRVYDGYISNNAEGSTIYTIMKDGTGRIELWTHFYADYLMGDPEYDYFDEEPFAPGIYYYNTNDEEFHDPDTLQARGVKLVSFTYPEPIENEFVYSHISHFSGMIVLPALAIAFLALIAMIIFVKKDKEKKFQVVDVISLVLNFAIGIFAIPIMTLLGMFVDITGGSPALLHQIFYFIPAFFMLCIAGSVALRRKGRGVQSLIVQIAGVGIVVLYVVICGVLGQV